MLEYSVDARRIDDHGSLATTKQAEITLDTDVKRAVTTPSAIVPTLSNFQRPRRFSGSGRYRDPGGCGAQPGTEHCSFARAATAT
jgi:hypothetical protein